MSWIIGWAGLPGVTARVEAQTRGGAKSKGWHMVRDAYPEARFVEIRVQRDLGIDPPHDWPAPARGRSRT